MSRRPVSVGVALWRAIGGGGVFTPWSWLAMAPVCLTILGGYDTATTDAERLTGVTVAAAVHGLTGLLMFVAATIERPIRSASPRALFAIVAAVAIGAARPLAIDAGQSLVGRQLFDGSMPTRIATNVVFTVVSLTLCGVVVNGIRRFRAVLARLRRVERALDAARNGDEHDLSALARQFLREAERMVVAALVTAHKQPFDPEEEARALRRLSAEVVRPLSHRLFESATTADAGASGPELPAEPMGGPRPRLALRPSPTLSWLAPVLYLAAALPALVANWGLPTALVHACVGLLVGVVGNYLVGRLSPRGHGFGMWFAAMALGFVAVGAAIGLSSTALGTLFGQDDRFLAVNLTAYPLLATATTLGSSVAWGLRDAEATLVRAVAESDRLTADARVRLVSAREHAARMLHSEVQGELVATALKLQRGLAGSAEVDSSRDRILEMFRRAERITPLQPEAVRESTLRVVDAWSSAIELDFRADPAAWDRLAADGLRGAVSLDALSEALSNVVRHASRPIARVRLYAPRDPSTEVRLEVRSPGPLSAPSPSAAEPSFGLADLGRRARSVTLREDDSDVVLTVTIT